MRLVPAPARWPGTGRPHKLGRVLPRLGWRGAARLVVAAGRLAEADPLFGLAIDACEQAGDNIALVDTLAAAQPSRLICFGTEVVGAGWCNVWRRYAIPLPRHDCCCCHGRNSRHRLMCTGVFSHAAARLGRLDEVAAESAAYIDPDADGDAIEPVLRNLRNVLTTIALWRAAR